jgi:hypothetical protein
MIDFWNQGILDPKLGADPIGTHNNLRVIRAANCVIDLGMSLTTKQKRFFAEALPRIGKHLQPRNGIETVASLIGRFNVACKTTIGMQGR